MASRRRPENEDLTPFTLDAGEPGPRVARIQHLLFEEIDRLFRMDVRDRQLQGVTIMSLHLSPDLRNAKVYYALPDVPPRSEQERRVKEGLLRVTPFLRAQVAATLGMKRTPDLHFHRDRTAE